MHTRAPQTEISYMVTSTFIDHLTITFYGIICAGDQCGACLNLVLLHRITIKHGKHHKHVNLLLFTFFISCFSSYTLVVSVSFLHKLFRLLVRKERSQCPCISA